MGARWCSQRIRECPATDTELEETLHRRERQRNALLSIHCLVLATLLGRVAEGIFLLDNRACLTLLRVSYQSVACVRTRRIVGRISLREGQLHTGCHLVNGLRPMTTQMDIGPAR
jgi:hypothetical protein